MGTYRITKTTDGQYLWNLHAGGNGEKILTSEGYTTKGAAFGGINSCKENSPHRGQYENRTATNGLPYFVLKAKNGEIIGTSEQYSSAAARDNGIASCIANGPTSGTEDKTGEK